MFSYWLPEWRHGFSSTGEKKKDIKERMAAINKKDIAVVYFNYSVCEASVIDNPRWFSTAEMYC